MQNRNLPTLPIDESEFQIDFIQSSGPGGQNVNKVATGVQLRFDIPASRSLGAEVKERLLKLAGSRVSAIGVLIIDARRYRSQEQNRLDALQRLAALIQQARHVPKIRRPTRPGVTARAARLGSKKRRGEIKRFRRYIPDDWE